jgi:hypothetical protein
MYYLQNDIAINSNSIKQVNQALINENSSLKNLSDLQQEQPVAAPALTNMSAIIPSEDMLFSVQHNFQAMAQGDNLAFSSEFGSETAPTANMPGEVAIEMTLQGSYGNVLTFLDNIESSAFVSVSSVDLIEEPTGGNFSAMITGNIPFHS